MNGSILAVIAIAAIAVIGGAVFFMGGNQSDDSSETTVNETTRDTVSEIDTGESSDQGASNAENNTSSDYAFTITYVSGTENAYQITSSSGQYTVTFSGISADTEYSIAGVLNGNIVIDAGDYDFDLDLNGVTITSTAEVPICITSGENVSIAAKKNTTNYVYDKRAAVSDEDISACIYSNSDLKLKGNGKLVVVSDNNNGVHSKDDLSVKNLTLYVTCVDNCLKGNDSVKITSGNIILNATSGDGIKTSNSELSSKGVQRGSVTINSDDGDTSLTIRAYCDGIDSAFDVIVEETQGNSVDINIIAGVEATSSASSVTSSPGGMPGGGSGWGGNPGGSSWGQGGPNSEGNNNKASYSCKGIKANNAIYINSGTLIIDAFDDTLHANNDEAIESGVTPTGNVTIAGGTVTLNSKDDGIHADGTLTVSGGTLRINGSYEALEGAYIVISGGNTSLISSDDGINATSSGLKLSGGYLYVYAGGDGLDCNRSSISFEGTDVIIISTSGGNSSIDADYSYSYTGGSVLAICPNGMTQEVTGSSAFRSYGSQQSFSSLNKGTVVTTTVNGTAMLAVKMPVSLSNCFAVYIGSTSATISSGSSSLSLNDDGAYVRA